MRLAFFEELITVLTNQADFDALVAGGLYHGEVEREDQESEPVSFPYAYYETDDCIEEESETSGSVVRRQGIVFHFISVSSAATPGDQQGMAFSNWIQKIITSFQVNRSGVLILSSAVVADQMKPEDKRSDAGSIVWHTIVGFEFLVDYAPV